MLRAENINRNCVEYHYAIYRKTDKHTEEYMELIIHLVLFSFSYVVQIFLFTLGAYYTVIMISGWIPFPSAGENKIRLQF